MPRMIKVGFYICLLAVFWLGTARAVEQKDGGPIIEIDSLTHDFKAGLYVCFLVVFWLGTASAVEQVEQKDAVPIIEIDPLTHDFKEVSQGETVRHDFTVRNNGTAPLQIKGVKPG